MYASVENVISNSSFKRGGEAHVAIVHHCDSHHNLAWRLILKPRHTGAPRGEGGGGAEKSTRGKGNVVHVENTRTARAFTQSALEGQGGGGSMTANNCHTVDNGEGTHCCVLHIDSFLPPTIYTVCIEAVCLWCATTSAQCFGLACLC